MISFNISNNPLQHLPAELASIKSLRKLIADGCDFQAEFVNERAHDPPTLFEQCARTIVHHQLNLPDHLPSHIQKYLATHQECSYCRGPYFESFVTRGRFIERVARQPIALEYRLCCAHWDDDQDRLLNLFSSPCATSSSTASLASRNHASSVSSSGATGSGPSHNDPSQGARKRSASSSSALSSSYRLFPALPPLPSLESCSGNARSFTPSSTATSTPSPSPVPTPSSSTMRMEQQPRPTINRPRANSSNSITKRFAHFLTPSKSSSSVMTRSRSHSSLRQEIILSPSPLHQENNSTAGPTLPSDEDTPSSPVDSAYHNDRQRRHDSSASVVLEDDNNLIADPQPLRHRMVGVNRAGVLPSTDTDESALTSRGNYQANLQLTTTSDSDDGVDKLAEQRHLLSLPQPLHPPTMA